MWGTFTPFYPIIYRLFKSRQHTIKTSQGTYIHVVRSCISTDVMSEQHNSAMMHHAKSDKEKTPRKAAKRCHPREVRIHTYPC